MNCKLFALALLFGLMVVATAVPANSLGIVQVSQDKGWRPAQVEAFFASVNYKDGLQNSVLAATISERISGQAFWLIPVPAKKSDVAINLFRQFPVFGGDEVTASSEQSLVGVYKGMLASQIYTLPFLSFASPGFSIENVLNKSNATESRAPTRIEALSAGAEVIPASEDALIKYFNAHRMELPSNMELIRGYLGENRSFVVAWISNSSAGITRGLFITYPARAPSMPLSTLQNYNYTVPVSIYLVGRYVFDYPEINESTSTEYFSQDGYGPPGLLKDFFFGNVSLRSLDYTKLLIMAAHQRVPRDLEFEVVKAEQFVFLDSLRKHPFLWGLLIYAVLSCFASLFAGIAVFHEYRPKPFKFFFFGLTNVFTLIGFWTIAYYSEIEREFTELENVIDQQVELTLGKKIALLTPIILLILVMITIPATIFLELGSIFMPIFMSNLFAFIFLPLLVFIILVLWGAFEHTRILVFNVAFTFIFLTLLIISLFTILSLI